MEENLVIVESPAKAKTIEKFLGKDYLVKSSFGHIRDLDKKDFGVDLNNHYQPNYIVSEDKKKVVAELKKYAKTAKTIWIASDEDREGEAIAWHLMEVLKLDPKTTKRIVFHEITKDAIHHAIDHPRHLNKDLVDAQQARRILDRLVGFEISPVLWKKVKPSLSAGRVQSVAVRLIVEREREITNTESVPYFRVTALFIVPEKSGKETLLKAECSERFEKEEDAALFLQKCSKAEFVIGDIVTKPAKKSPAPPFTTSTLQQEASRKMGFPVSLTMSVAQRLYEAGKITYMRTDSTNLSQTALNSAKKKITDSYGEKYVKIRHYKTNAKGAQEAHEAIRPTDFFEEEIAGSAQEQKLYNLIWKRTLASQMADAELERTNVTINISNTSERFLASGEVLKFDGFLGVYLESSDEENLLDDEKGLLPPLVVKQKLVPESILALQRFSQKPARYTEASLVKKLEELGIGRPSTYAPTITTIQQRDYVVKEDREGIGRSYVQLILKAGNIKRTEKTEIAGAEKAKLFPTDIGLVVNDFLMKHFEPIVDFYFTATVEKQFDEIAEGSLVWQKMIDDFYLPFHRQIEDALANSERARGERILGIDPVSGKNISAKIGRFGPFIQLGETSEDGSEKPAFASLQQGQSIETITIEQALKLFDLPRDLGEYEGKKVTVGIGKFGPYVKHDSNFASLKKGMDDPYTILLDRAIELILERREKISNSLLKTFTEDPEIRILQGRWGPYISYKKQNFKLKKDTGMEQLTYSFCKEIINAELKKPKQKKSK
ncbi:MAG: type I DNA topoisomerase [Prolixibacteraceae bacterium]|jgi:DNA topoisomerase-1|nr:type I DNA topoisomerase [Prolixibacteraceae bacterium]